MNLSLSKFVTVSLTLAVGACARGAATEPHAMSAPQHEASAAKEEREASQHTKQYAPGLTAKSLRCNAGQPCWTSTRNPTEQHRILAEEHRKLAAEHRASSQALRDAEGGACAGVPDEDRDMSPFLHGSDIERVTQLREQQGPQGSTRDAGATVVFHSSPGMTKEWLETVINCHLARNAAVGHDMLEMGYCPLVPRGVQAKVRSVADGLAVDLRSDDPNTAAEIWRRARRLKAAP